MSRTNGAGIHLKSVGVSDEQISDHSALIQEIVRLSQAGFSLLPLGGGSDGKGPLLGFKNAPYIPLKSVLGVMHGKRSHVYGIRLSKLIVVDIDCDTDASRSFVKKHFGVSTVQVKTPRGMHHYYNLPAGTSIPGSIRQDEIAIDFKYGINSYVAGPHSVRPDGGKYQSYIGVLGETPLPDFKVVRWAPCSGADCKIKPAGDWERRVATGKRNAFLTRKAVEFVECVDSETELLNELIAQRDYDCEDPKSIPESELIGIAAWAWTLRLENRVFSGRNSGVVIKRDIMDKLLGVPFGQNAFALHCILVANHGHIPGKRFRIDPHAMKRDGLISFGRDACFQARNLLIETGLLRRVGNYKPGSHPQHYQLIG